MKLRDLEVIGGSVYVNLVKTDETITETLSAKKAIDKYGEYEVIEHTPYAGETNDDDNSDTNNGKKNAPQKGTDIVILEG